MPTQGPELRDVHVPHVGWWPLAPGWWVLAGLLIALVLITALLLARRARRRRHVHAVLGDLRQARSRHASDGDNAAFAATAHQLLRRVARTRDPYSVTLSAAAWRDALAAMAPKRDVARLATLGDAMYRRDTPLDVDAVAADVEAWVRDVLMRGAPRRPGRAHA
ncbi:DUF4381 domain-containing protein [Luteibacter yeojuensis]|uniref:DUF4381 domain-containing protein n=1 Tax=Luteibacter yeojuensis TaxID=345309 RepID=UPI0006969173|nr:DUF4381 domain-containing protein [Luteibacter yeojuensis]